MGWQKCVSGKTISLISHLNILDDAKYNVFKSVFIVINMSETFSMFNHVPIFVHCFNISLRICASAFQSLFNPILVCSNCFKFSNALSTCPFSYFVRCLFLSVPTIVHLYVNLFFNRSSELLEYAFNVISICFNLFSVILIPKAFLLSFRWSVFQLIPDIKCCNGGVARN